MAAALGIAGFVMPVSNGDNMFKGHSVKPVHGRQAAMCGLSSAWLAKSGYRAGPLEGEPPRHHGALRMLSKAVHLERAVAGLGETWRMRDVLYKPYPIGGLITGVVEVILGLLAERAIESDKITAVDVTTYKHAVNFTGNKYTTMASNCVDAHRSIPCCVAAALIDGEMTQRRAARLADRKLHDLAVLVRVTEYPAMTAAYPEDWPARVVIRMYGGEVVERRIDKVKWSPQRPPTWGELAAKFHDMVDPMVGPERATRAVQALAGLGSAGTLEAVLEPLRQEYH